MKMGSILDYCLMNFNNQNAPDNTGDFGGYDLAIPSTNRQISVLKIPVEITVSAMDEGQVQKGLICAWWGSDGELISNDEVAASVKHFPDRFVRVGSVNLYKPMDAVREVRRCVNKLGFKGLRSVQWFWNLVPTDRRYYPVFAECVEQNIPVCLQVGHTGPLCPSEREPTAMRLLHTRIGVNEDEAGLKSADAVLSRALELIELVS